MAGMGFSSSDLGQGSTYSVRDQKAKALRMSESLDKLLDGQGRDEVTWTSSRGPGAPGRVSFEDLMGGGDTVTTPVRPITQAVEETDTKRRQDKYEKLREQFVRTNDPVTKAAMLQMVEMGALPLTPAEQTNRDIADYLADLADQGGQVGKEAAGGTLLLRPGPLVSKCTDWLVTTKPGRVSNILVTFWFVASLFVLLTMIFA